jgi:hypothetical protein
VGRGRAFLLFVLASASLSALDLPSGVTDALDLELGGRLGEALEAYRTALASDEALAGDEVASRPVTIWALTKAAHLCIDLGQGEEAWDLGGRLLASPSQEAVEAGTLVRMRLLRLRGRPAEALVLNESYAKAFPKGTSSPSLLTEVWRSRRLAEKPVGSVQSLLEKRGGPAAWVLAGSVSAIPGPVDAWGLSFQEPVRLQVGAFQDWSHALTLVDMLREKGWVPLTEVKTGPGGEKLHVVYVVSRRPDSDRARLEAQGLGAP